MYVKAIFVGIMLTALLLIASSMSYQDELIEQQAYCQKVKAGVWPDYKNILSECNKVVD